MANSVIDRFFDESRAHAAFQLLGNLPRVPDESSTTLDGNAAHIVVRKVELKHGDRVRASLTLEVGDLTSAAAHDLMRDLQLLAVSLGSSIRGEGATWTVTVTTELKAPA